MSQTADNIITAQQNMIGNINSKNKFKHYRVLVKTNILTQNENGS